MAKANRSFPDYANAVARNFNNVYVENTDGYLIAQPKSVTMSESGWIINILGKTYKFYQGYSGSDYNHATNGWFKIPKNTEYSLDSLYTNPNSTTYEFIPLKEVA